VRRAAKVDANQAAIVEALREAGCNVQPLHMVGRGCPDIMVGRAGRLWLMEIKDGDKPPSARKLTEDEREWHELWAEQKRAGAVVVVESVAEALAVVGVTR
jgi:Holliday junction resolvase